MPQKAPKLYKHLLEFYPKINKELEILLWEPDSNKYSSDDSCKWQDLLDSMEQVRSTLAEYHLNFDS